MKPLLRILCFAATAAVAFAADPADLTLKNGTVLKNYKVMSSDPANLLIKHSGGIETVALADLPADIQTKYGYDAAKAGKHAEEVKARSAQYRAELAASAEKANQEAKLAQERQQRQTALAQSCIDAQLEVLQVVDGGILAKGYGRMGPVSYVDVSRSQSVLGTGLDAGRYVNKTWTEKEDARPVFSLGDRIFVECATDGLIDGQNVKASIWAAGTYAYTNTLGARMTVKKYTTAP